MAHFGERCPLPPTSQKGLYASYRTLVDGSESESEWSSRSVSPLPDSAPPAVHEDEIFSQPLVRNRSSHSSMGYRVKSRKAALSSPAHVCEEPAAAPAKPQPTIITARGTAAPPRPPPPPPPPPQPRCFSSALQRCFGPPRAAAEGSHTQPCTPPRCHLMFSEASGGSMLMQWGEPSEGASLACFEPGVPTPAFKLHERGGRSELCRGVGGPSAKPFYQGWLSFIKIAQRQQGRLTHLSNLPSRPVALYFATGKPPSTPALPLLSPLFSFTGRSPFPSKAPPSAGSTSAQSRTSALAPPPTRWRPSLWRPTASPSQSWTRSSSSPSGTGSALRCRWAPAARQLPASLQACPRACPRPRAPSSSARSRRSLRRRCTGHRAGRATRRPARRCRQSAVLR